MDCTLPFPKIEQLVGCILPKWLIDRGVCLPCVHYRCVSDFAGM